MTGIKLIGGVGYRRSFTNEELAEIARKRKEMRFRLFCAPDKPKERRPIAKKKDA